jgi:hypothetical protein
MTHIATVQWKTAKWIIPQQTFLRKHLKGEYRVYAWLNDITEVPPASFYFTCSEPVVSHAVKLNILADVVCLSSNRDDDVLIFLDGDAFPIGDIESLLKQKLSTHKLVAVQRLENYGDVHPHPCFCATTVGFWRTIKGDWKEGYQWPDKKGNMGSDVGGNLFKQLRENQIEWFPLLRSNRKNLHPVFFGIYGGIIYHHGAGFRFTECYADGANFELPTFHKILGNILPGYRRSMRKRLLRVIANKNGLVSERIFSKIQNDPYFYNEFL